MKKVKIQYCVTFGAGDSSDWLDYELELTDEEEIIYNNAIENKIPLNSITELENALDRVYSEIEEMEIQNNLAYGDEYTAECQGNYEMDPDDLNELIADRDPYALEFFGLTDASEDELDKWDANNLEELPLVRDFDEDFEEESPFDEGWSISLEFVDPNEL